MGNWWGKPIKTFIFDLTNYAIFNKWALKEAIIDILWGGFLFTIVGYIVHKFNF